MANIQEIIQKIPKPILVIGVLTVALALIVFQNPLQDGCDVQVSNFNRSVRGILIGYKTKKNLTQYAQIENFKNLCREGNSSGSCENYYEALKKITAGLKTVEGKCFPKLLENYENLPKVLSNGIQVMALNAWGEVPPAGVNDRLGWLAEAEIFTFCRLKAQYILLSSEEDYRALRARTYSEFPDLWPDTVKLDERSELSRPRVLKSKLNPNGTLNDEDIFKRSLFSLRCDLYL